jgi:capsular exopolysaccharide synthesis family protein
MANGRPALLPQPTALSSGPDLPGLLRALQRRWLLALGLGLVLAPAAGFAAWFLLSARYTAFAQLYLASVPPWVVDRNVATAESRSEFLSYQRTQAARLKSRLVLGAALARDEVKHLSLLQQQNDPLAWLEDELRVEFQEGNEILTVLLSGSAPEQQVLIVDAVTKAYEQQVVNAERDRRAARVKELDKIYSETDRQLRDDRDKRRALAEQLETTDSQVLTQRQISLLSDLTELKKQHSQVRFELMNAQRRLESYRVQEATLKETPVPTSNITEVLAADAVLRNHQTRLRHLHEIIRDCQQTATRQDDQTLARAQRQYQDELAQFEARRAALQASAAQRAQQKNRSDYDAIAASMQNDVKTLTAQVEALRAEILVLDEKAKKIGTSSTELEMLRSKILRQEKYADKVWDDVELLRAEQRSPPRVSLLQPAALQKKDMKRQIMGAVGAPVLTLILSALAVAWLEFRLRRIRTASEVASGLGIPVVGAVPPLGRQPVNTQEGVLESIDALRTQLLHDDNLEATRVVMVTSAAPGEGKTTLACSLADSLARSGRKTLLIDCDLRSPAAHQLFELPLQPGFSEILLGEIDAADAIHPTPMNGLWLISAGQWDREVLQALAREGIQEIFEKLKEEFDFIVVDSHPVLGATDSLLLSQHVDAVLLSILRDVSRSPRVYSACQRLATLGVRILGAVVNGTAPDEVYVNSQPQSVMSAVQS